ncbi:hypothetical protein EN866_19550 [Mesorhizobium sp. M2D.F.Ca.ET.223.01.1.1]|uniref:hypothetical protein n=1 Tax=unclassified Mesorhizobium TaxID=325217 RepID=UPI000FCB93E8|nr:MULTISPECIES: hypothetical protein [unclassified Mesorhizobium]TGP89357.1 hypothetical protein EN864_19560 [bacterium M00.F.Ca.ET.221.01.1.1]TGP94730.1 hypothetical protein EN865_15430 [bacterium M00.F.Ca.ET.222.01.1.1]RVD58856.1 hypothetical protein EN783_14565 [Mesorhizobium sp. M2D.F.Ca.ET.140.01.1.1]TGP27885.1 hypothetical protein EN875_033050 [Mesorhizobium sp. M2D.F.Ca.ET.232.01.1.1]TGP75898.1 hypothetical protein EN867_15430 [Mesorhizobium sp. M2D.F.Ca.ET.224.01.1.1]
MSYDTLRVKVGRRPITVVELDLDFCSNTYGVAPCTAAVGTTGAQKCFNTFSTCQDTANYAKSVKTYRFVTPSPLLPIGQTLFPCITSVDLAPVQIDPKGFSVSASVTVELQDFPHHDRGIDPYPSDRAYNPRQQGTFFGKLRGRNPYLENRVMRVMEGYVDADRTIYTRTRTYFIDRMEGPDADGRVRIIGKDALRFADASKAQAPALSKGSLAANMTNVANTLTLQPAGIGSTYPASGTVRIDDEVMTYASISGDTLNGIVRATDGTVAATHDASTVVQLCIRYTNATTPFILNDLLTNYAGINSSYIPLTAWNTEYDTWLGTITSTVLLSEPTGVKDLIQEIQQATGTYLWWDDIAALIQFKALVPPLPSSPPPLLNEMQHFLAGSITVKDSPKDRVSQVLMYFAPYGAISELKAENFKSVSIQVDTTGEGVNAYGTSNSMTVLNRWVSSLQVVDEIAVRILNRYKETPRQITFSLDAKDAALKTGDLVDISSRLIQGVDGLPRLIRCLVTQSRETLMGSQYEYTVAQVSSSTGNAALIAPDGTPDWTLATDEQKRSYMYISNDLGVMSDLSPGPRIT